MQILKNHKISKEKFHKIDQKNKMIQKSKNQKNKSKIQAN